MSTSTKSEQVQTNPEVTYEKRDVNTRVILYFVAGLFAVLVITLVSMRGLFGYFSETQNLGPGASPFDNSRTLPPAPRLQVQPSEDLDRVRQAQEQILNSYGWENKATGTVRVPIDRAMDMLMQRRLPVRQSPPAGQNSETAGKEQTK